MNSRETDQLGRRLKTISGDIKLYIEKRVELLLLNIGEHFSRMLAESVHKVAGLLMLSGASVCLLIALAHFLGDLLNNESLGYVLVSVPLFILGFMFWYLKPKSLLDQIKTHFEREIIRALSTNGENQKPKLQLGEPDIEKEFKSNKDL